MEYFGYDCSMSRTMDWNPEDALIFVQVVDAGSFTAAAQSLGLPKSNVSRRVSRLEEASRRPASTAHDASA